jgi:uncharacterized membrane protein
MQVRLWLPFVAASLLATGVRSDPPAQEPDPNLPQSFIFYANGSEPFWSLMVDNKVATLERPESPALSFRYAPFKSTHVGLRFQAKTKSTAIDILFLRQTCLANGSGDSLPYTVTVYIGKETLKGCGKRGTMPEGSTGHQLGSH